MPPVKQYIYVVGVRAPGMTINQTKHHIIDELKAAKGHFHPEDERFNIHGVTAAIGTPEFLRRMADIIEHEQQKENRAP